MRIPDSGLGVNLGIVGLPGLFCQPDAHPNAVICPRLMALAKYYATPGYQRHSQKIWHKETHRLLQSGKLTFPSCK